MSPQAKEFSRRRARQLIGGVLLFVAAGIALANFSSEPVSLELVQRITSKPDRAWQPSKRVAVFQRA
jgi:hypothetical protein